jgi:hypothetical protein
MTVLAANRGVRRLMLAATLVLTTALSAAAPAKPAAPPAPLAFTVREGLNINAFTRQGPVAAHLLLRSGKQPRILVAFPAGNSGVALWFARAGQPVAWTLATPPRPLTQRDAKGRPLHGIVAEASTDAAELTLDRAVLSNVRVLRDVQAGVPMPDGLDAKLTRGPASLDWARDRLDGKGSYRLRLDILSGRLDGDRIVASGKTPIRLRITALSGDPALTPIGSAALLNASAAKDPDARNALEFLSYQEKFLAGSWRFNTYFGRDTLMSVRLLMPALQPAAVEAGLRSVLARLKDDGDVAHEEDIGEFAILDHRRKGEPLTDAPVYDYKMVDDDYMLAPVTVAWLLDDPRGRARAAAFLAAGDRREGGRARRAGDDLVANLRFVLATAAPFAEAPRYDRLIKIRDGFMAGQWRDSDEGLGRGRYAYDVNAVFVPAALEAAARLHDSGLLKPYLSAGDKALFARAATMAARWREAAPPLFALSIPADRAKGAVGDYARALGLDPAPALAALGDAPLRFQAISLNADGSAVPVVHSDVGFALMFGAPDPMSLDIMLDEVTRPFPAGLMTDAGMVVANAALAGPEAQQRLSPNAYHGAVVWSWQQALMAAGLARQLARADLPAASKARLRAAQRQLWSVIATGRAIRNSELWSWRYADGRYIIRPWGESEADPDESNAAQLWSTVYLGVRPPE